MKNARAFFQLFLSLSLLAATASSAVAQQAEPLDASRIPSRPLRYEQVEGTADPDVQAKKPREIQDTPGVSDDFTRKRFHIGLTAQTVFPTFLGAGVEISYRWKLALGLQAGLTPRLYSDAIADAAASFAGEPSYRDVVRAAFEKNSTFRMYTEYRFGSRPRGWRLGLSYSHLDSSGSAPIDTALEAATGRDFTLLKTLLTLQGRDANVDMDATLGLGELYIGYGWRAFRDLFIGLDLGVAKIFASDVHLETNLPAYENSQAGSNQLRASESDMEDILKKYGLTPTLSLRAGYFF